jgi:hypothetical protein
MRIEDLKDSRDRDACIAAEKRRRPAFYSSGNTVRWKDSESSYSFAVDAPGEDGQVKWPEPKPKNEDED